MHLHELAVFVPLLAMLSSPSEEGQALLGAGRYEEALKAFRKAVAQDKRCGPCFLGMAEAHHRLRQHRDAVKSCDRALELGLADPLLRAKAQGLKGVLLFQLAEGRSDRLSSAETHLRLALASNPEDPGTQLNLGVVILAQRRDEEGIAYLRSLLDRAPEGPVAEAARRYIENPRRAREPFAPAFSAVLAAGGSVSLESLKGKVVVLDFWATWCRPCREAVPELKDLVRRYGERPFVLLSISIDEDETAWRTFLQKNAMTWPQSRDAEARLARLFGVDAFPTYIVLDAEGAIRGQIRGTDARRSVAYRLKDTLKSMPELSAR